MLVVLGQATVASQLRIRVLSQKRSAPNLKMELRHPGRVIAAERLRRATAAEHPGRTARRVKNVKVGQSLLSPKSHPSKSHLSRNLRVIKILKAYFHTNLAAA